MRYDAGEYFNAGIKKKILKVLGVRAERLRKADLKNHTNNNKK